MQCKKIRARAGTILLYGLLFVVFVAPLLRLLLMSLAGPGGYGMSNFILLFQDKHTLDAIGNTLLIAVASTVMAAGIGSTLALIVAYTNIKRKRLIEMLILMPFIIPSYIITLSWSGLFSQRGMLNQFLESCGAGPVNIYSTVGILLVIGICNVPIVYLSVIHMLRRIPADMEWAARACGFGVWQTLRKVDLAEARPAILSGSLLSFLAAVDNFSVPAFLGISSHIPVLSTYIYEKAISFGPDAFPMAAALSVILSGMAAAGTLLEGCLLKKGDALESIKEDHSVRIPLSMRCRRLLEWGLITILGLIDIVPLVSMTASAFLKNYGLAITSANLSLKNFAFVCTNAGVLSAVRNSLMLAVVTCAACILIGTAMAYMKVRRHSRVTAVAEKCASLTYAIPGIVLSLAMIFHWAEPLPGVHPGIYGTIHILIIAYITRYLILQIKGSTTALLAVNPELEDAVRASGRGPRVLWQKILIPLLVQPVLAGSFLIFVSALTELTLSSMLASAGTKTIGLTIFNFQQAGDYSLSAAMSAIIVILVLGGYGMTRFTSGQKEGETENEPVSRTHRKKVWPGMGTQGH